LGTNRRSLLREAAAMMGVVEMFRITEHGCGARVLG
jgi:hypothetical protein